MGFDTQRIGIEDYIDYFIITTIRPEIIYDDNYYAYKTFYLKFNQTISGILGSTNNEWSNRSTI